MNAATPLGAWVRSVMSFGFTGTTGCKSDVLPNNGRYGTIPLLPYRKSGDYSAVPYVKVALSQLKSVNAVTNALDPLYADTKSMYAIPSRCTTATCYHCL